MHYGLFLGIFCSLRTIIQLAIKMPTATVPIIRLANALISGVTPSLIFENMTIGNVLAPAPDVKLAITKSSSDRVKANSQPDSIDGVMSGKVMSNATCMGLPPRSIAASWSDRSMLDRRDCTITAT